ncbi:AhpD-like protein [Xylariaceae sp. FL0662B]|nr:AhpD-like protein [Xylariaceae sp. FL0662B]
MRIRYTPSPPTPASPAEAEIIARIAARRAPRPLQPLDLALLHAPAVADGWNGFLGAIRTGTGAVPAAARELAICRVAVVNGAWYEWGHHAPLALAAGVGHAALALVRRSGGEDLVDSVGEEERVAAGLDDRLWAVLRYADQMTRRVRVEDKVFEALRRACASEREVVEVTAIVAAYNCVSRFLVALDVGERNNTGPDDVVAH